MYFNHSLSLIALTGQSFGPPGRLQGYVEGGGIFITDDPDEWLDQGSGWSGLAQLFSMVKASRSKPQRSDTSEYEGRDRSSVPKPFFSAALSKPVSPHSAFDGYSCLTSDSMQLDFPRCDEWI